MKVPTVDFDDSEAEAKRAYLCEVAARHDLDVFVETGTAEGHTVAAMVKSGLFSTIISIELGDAKYIQSAMQFLDEPTVKTLHGDSAQVLGRVVRALDDRPTLFWLDAHLTAADGVGDSTPIDAEMRHVLHHRPRCEDVVLVDDARFFGADPAYPTLDHFTGMIKRWHDPKGSSRFDVFVERDIIHVVPRRSE